jgi:hypothetical protein
VFNFTIINMALMHDHFFSHKTKTFMKKKEKKEEMLIIYYKSRKTKGLWCKKAERRRTTNL